MRLYDNQVLDAALQSADQVIPLFILDPNLLTSRYSSNKRYKFLIANLNSLDQSLKQLGSMLYVRSGKPIDELTQFMQETKAQNLFAEPDYSPYAQARDKQVSQSLPITWVGSPAVHAPGSVLRQDGGIFTVFTPFSKAWKSLPLPSLADLIGTPVQINTPRNYPNQALSKLNTEDFALFPAGEAEAQHRLQDFTHDTEKIFQYSINRDRPDLEGTSKLSPYLRFGIISARQAVAHALHAMNSTNNVSFRKSAEVWLNELIWREFYIHILYHFPQVREKNFRLENIAWQNDPQALQAWQEGETGYPIVDAAMRQLNQTGWMHNRTRMITASFLTKDLLIDWRLGEEWFMKHLIDGDPASNNGGWQWTAGTGTDAAPYFRIFNPISQSVKFDPDGDYIRRWVPELAQVPGQYIHEPWTMPFEIQVSSQCIVGKDYPAPIVDHGWARQRVLAVFGNAK